MRVAVFASAIGLSLVGLSSAQDALASMRRPTDIPAQNLGTALQSLARERHFQLVFRSELVGGLRTNGAAGDLTLDEALRQLLSDTGLSFQYVDDKTITIMSTQQAPRGSSSGERAPAQESAPPKSFWDRFRLAQVGAASTGSVVSEGTSEPKAASVVEEVVVTAQKRRERLLDVPVPVTAISAETLSSSNQLRLEDYYTRIPGLSLTTVQPFGSSTVAIRGVVTGYYQSPTVGVTVDDVPYTSSTTVGFGNAVSDVDPADLAGIEVLRGPQGTLYGASSMGGLIKYVTIDPSTDGMSGQVQVGANGVKNGNDPGYNVRGAINVPVSSTFALRASGFTRRDPGYIDDPANGERGVNWGQVSGGRLSTLWRPSEDLSLKLGAVFQETNFHGSAEVDAVPGLGELEQNRPPSSGGYRKSFQVYNANLNARLGSAQLTSVTAYARNENRFKWDFSATFGELANVGIPGFFPGFGVNGVTSDQDVSTHKFTQEVRLVMPLGARVDWLVGAFYGREETPRNVQVLPVVEFSTNVRVGELAHLYYTNTFEEYAAFTDFTFTLSDRFDVQVGGRESRNSQDFQNTNGGLLFVGAGGADAVQPPAHSKDNAFTYLLTPRWKILPDLMAYARFASGYRPGGPNGAITLTSNLPKSYDPDTTRSYEVGIKGDALEHRLSFDASIYYIDWRDIQLQLVDSGSGVTYYDNAGSAKSHGLELAIESRPIDGLRVSASGTWSLAELTEDFPVQAGTARKGDRLPFSSRFSGSVSLDQEFPLAQSVLGFVGGSVSYVGERPSAIGSKGPQNFPSYTKTDLHAGLRRDSWTANLFVNNLSDRRGVLNVNAPHAVTYIQPRSYGVSFVKDF